MKTAMQELFSQLEIEYRALFNTNTLEGRKFVNDYYKFLEMEKEMIIESWINGYTMADNGYDFESEQYYKETFKNK